MNQNRTHRNELLAQTVMKGLETRNMSGYYAEKISHIGGIFLYVKYNLTFRTNVCIINICLK